MPPTHLPCTFWPLLSDTVHELALILSPSCTPGIICDKHGRAGDKGEASASSGVDAGLGVVRVVRRAVLGRWDQAVSLVDLRSLGTESGRFSLSQIEGLGGTRLCKVQTFV